MYLLGKSHGQKSLEDYSPWGCKEMDMPEQLSDLTWLVSFKKSEHRHQEHIHLGITMSRAARRQPSRSQGERSCCPTQFTCPVCSCCHYLVLKSCLTLLWPWTVAHQAPLSMGFLRQEHGSGLPFPSPGDLPHPGVKPGSPALQVDSLLLSSWGTQLPIWNLINYERERF